MQNFDYSLFSCVKAVIVHTTAHYDAIDVIDNTLMKGCLKTFTFKNTSLCPFSSYLVPLLKSYFADLSVSVLLIHI